jgi:hypothetical protein
MQVIRGPVLLVTVGVLFAVHQAGILSFSRTWPLLIIVIGVMKLLERTSAPPPQWPNQAQSTYPQSAPYSRPGSYTQPPYAPQPPSYAPAPQQTQSNVPPPQQGGNNA